MTDMNGSDDATGCTTKDVDEAPELKQGETKAIPQSRATGPRTERGKAVSSKNALKFGIFSKELVIRNAYGIADETEEKFNRLLEWYVDHYQPEGPVEMHQLEIGVGALWRYRRLLRGEGQLVKEKSGELQYAFTCVGSEKFPRYESHLLRIYYRALSELERLQRMRLGHTVPAPVVVDFRN